MNVSRGFLGLSLLVAGLLAAARGSDATDASPSNAVPVAGNAVAGKQTFTEYCSVCHGAGAKGFIGPNIAGINWTADGLHSIVRGGVGGYGGMPAFNADAVTDRNIADIAAYLYSLAPSPPPQPSPTLQPAAPPQAAPPQAAPPPSAPHGSPPSPGADVAHGRQVYLANCAACHGANAQGGVGPSLRDEKSRKNDAAAVAWIKHPKPPMPALYPVVLSAKDVDDVAAYVESL